MQAHICREEHRNLLNFIMAEEGARKCVMHLIRMGATNLRPDYMLVRNAQGTYDRVPDPGAWLVCVPNHINPREPLLACMIRHRDGEWLLHS